MFHDLARDDVFRLETRRLWLRWPQAADAPAVAALAGDWDVARMTGMPHPYAIEHADQFICASRENNARGRGQRFAMTLKSGKREMVGVVSVEASGGRFVLGYWLGRPYWGRGLASEAAQAVVDAFFRFTEAEALGALAQEENMPSLGLLEKLGFTEVERLESGPGRHCGRPTLRLALRREDWRAQGANLPPGLRSVTA
jgi:RimJ/RimL family protein N-acetyltransferase